MDKHGQIWAERILTLDILNCFKTTFWDLLPPNDLQQRGRLLSDMTVTSPPARTSGCHAMQGRGGSIVSNWVTSFLRLKMNCSDTCGVDDASLVQTHLSGNLKTRGGFAVAPQGRRSGSLSLCPPCPQLSSCWLNKSNEASQCRSVGRFVLSDERSQALGITVLLWLRSHCSS